MKDTDREELQSALNRMMEAAGSWKRERSQLVAACEQLRRQLRDRDNNDTNAGVQPANPGADPVPSSWEEERAHLLAQQEHLRSQLTQSEEGAGIALERQIATAVERVRSELVAENSKLRDELQRAPDSAAQWAAERNQILTELERTTQLVAETEEAAAIALDRQIATAVKRAREEWAAEEEKLREEIRQLELERGNSSESSDQIADAVDSSRKEWAVERDRMRQELDAAMHLCARRGAESAELSAERDRLRQSLAEAEDDRLALAQRERAGIEDAHNEAAAAIERTRTELEAEKALLRRHAEEDLAELLTELDDSKVLLTEAQSAYAGVVSQLKESERRIAELFGERDQLREQLEDVTNAAAQKELERQQLKEEYDRTSRILDEATRPGNSLETTEFVVAEEVRVEELIRDLSTIIDDPATELSAVIRKTVERAQLDFYLKGLRFSVTGESATPTH